MTQTKEATELKKPDRITDPLTGQRRKSTEADFEKGSPYMLRQSGMKPEDIKARFAQSSDDDDQEPISAFQKVEDDDDIPFPTSDDDDRPDDFEDAPFDEDEEIENIGDLGGSDEDDEENDAETDIEQDDAETAKEPQTEAEKVNALEDIEIKEIETLAANDVQILNDNEINTVQQLVGVADEWLADTLEVNIEEAKAILSNAQQLLKVRAGVLVEAEDDGEGNRFLPGVKPLVNARLEELGRDMKKKRDAMTAAREAYTAAEELLREYMGKEGISEYKLESGETLFIDITRKAKISKKPKSSEEDGSWL